MTREIPEGQGYAQAVLYTCAKRRLDAGIDVTEVAYDLARDAAQMGLPDSAVSWVADRLGLVERSSS